MEFMNMNLHEIWENIKIGVAIQGGIIFRTCNFDTWQNMKGNATPQIDLGIYDLANIYIL